MDESFLELFVGSRIHNLHWRGLWLHRSSSCSLGLYPRECVSSFGSLELRGLNLNISFQQVDSFTANHRVLRLLNILHGSFLNI